MGVTRFLVSSPDVLPSAALERIYFTGIDGIPAASSAAWDNGIEVEREISDSGNYQVPWTVAGRGEITLATASLPERDEPYRLAVELARGTLSQLRNQAGEWQEIGLVPPAGFKQMVRQTTHLFGEATRAGRDLAESEKKAGEVIRQALEEGELLAAAFVDQALAVRKRQNPQLATSFGCSLEQTLLSHERARRFLAISNSAIVALNWRHVEPTEGNYQWQIYDQQAAWCRQQQISVVGGPVLKLDATGCPDWLCLWEGDFENLVQLVTDYVETAVSRFRGKVDLWNCAARFATGEALSLGEDECLHLAARAVESTRRADPDTPAILTFDQPWAEYMRLGKHQLSPLHVADALLRSELGLSGIGLELNLGYYPHGSQVRSLLTLNRLLDWWSGFGLPLYLFLTLPSGSQPDPAARMKTKVLDEKEAQAWTDEKQLACAEKIISLSVAKPTVRGVYWNQWRDDEPHDFPHGGLIDAEKRDKPLLTFMRRFRRRNLV